MWYVTVNLPRSRVILAVAGLEVESGTFKATRNSKPLRRASKTGTLIALPFPCQSWPGKEGAQSLPPLPALGLVGNAHAVPNPSCVAAAAVENGHAVQAVSRLGGLPPLVPLTQRRLNIRRLLYVRAGVWWAPSDPNPPQDVLPGHDGFSCT